MQHRQWVFLMIIVVGAILALGIAGIPSTHHDTPLHVLTTTPSVAPATTSGTG